MKRKKVIDRWKRLNHQLNVYNKFLTEVYGGPDVKEEDDPTGTVRSRELVRREQKGLEEAMTDEEFDTTAG